MANVFIFLALSCIWRYLWLAMNTNNIHPNTFLPPSLSRFRGCSGCACSYLPPKPRRQSPRASPHRRRTNQDCSEDWWELTGLVFAKYKTSNATQHLRLFMNYNSVSTLILIRFDSTPAHGTLRRGKKGARMHHLHDRLHAGWSRQISSLHAYLSHDVHWLVFYGELLGRVIYLSVRFLRQNSKTG